MLFKIDNALSPKRVQVTSMKKFCDNLCIPMYCLYCSFATMTFLKVRSIAMQYSPDIAYFKGPADMVRYIRSTL